MCPRSRVGRRIRLCDTRSYEPGERYRYGGDLMAKVDDRMQAREQEQAEAQHR